MARMACFALLAARLGVGWLQGLYVSPGVGLPVSRAFLPVR